MKIHAKETFSVSKISLVINVDMSGFKQYSTVRSKAVVLVLSLLFVALWFPHCFLLLFFCVCFFYMCCDASIVVSVYTSCPLCFLFY